MLSQIIKNSTSRVVKLPYATPCKYRDLIICNHILTILDRFSKYFIAIQLPDLETKTIPDALTMEVV